MNTRNTYIAFFMLGFCIPHSCNVMEKSTHLISNRETSFLAMVKSNPSYLEFSRFKRLAEEYDQSMQDIFAHAMLKPHSVLPNSFCPYPDAHPIIAPTQGLPELSWVQHDDLSCSYYCGLCAMKFVNSEEYKAHLVHCFPNGDTAALS